jgi:DNA-binding CsgD family transcriptional regulator
MAKGDAFLALGLLELSLGRGEAAAAAYRSVPTPSWGEWLPFAGGRVKLDAIEAFAETGDLARARELAETLPPDAHERPFADALLAPDVDEAIARVRAAEPSPAPYRRAREQLLLGRLLRRARRRADARAVLTDAQAAFERLGAPCWAERAADERARLGGRAPSGNRLTASESRVAELVASGLSNKEVAAELVVTARTVEAHLSKIYAKLGVRSRAALAATWNAHPYSKHCGSPQ